MRLSWFEAHGLDYSYGNRPMAVRGVSISAEPGSMTAIIGANGSGKSTLIRMLAGLLTPSAGTIHFNGVPLRQWEPHLRARQIAYVPQSTAAAFPFPATDIVLSGRAPHARSFRFETAHDMAVALAALEEAGAVHLAARQFTALSKGEQQMVVLARALAQQPRLMLLDEPSSSLDLKHRGELIRTLTRLRETKKLSVIMITHDLQLIGSFDQVLALRCGAMAASGPPSEVLREHVLQDIYDDPNVRTHRMGLQTLVWVDL